jgi:hypothetical protein
MLDVVYTPALLPEYAGNPLIESLPPMGRTNEEMLQAMISKPSFDPKERLLPAFVRREMVYRLTELFVPMPVHFDLLDELSICVRRSYAWRNPLSAETQAYLHHPSASSVEGKFLSIRAASSFLMLVKGVSGNGKSKGIEACLRALGPQVIRHRSYHGVQIHETQLVWLKVSCPEDRSLKTLCLAILRAADAALGERKYATPDRLDPRVSAGALVDAVFTCLANEHVGVLAVDELQNIFASRGTAAVEMLNFLLRLKDESGVCQVLCGTYASLQLLGQKFRLARRIAGGEVELTLPADSGDADWQSLARILWHFQWLPKPLPYCEEYGEVLFDLTRGVRGVAVWLFILTQADAIRSSSDSINSDDLRCTWRRRFSQLDKAMAALRCGKPADLAKWDDLCDSLTLEKLAQHGARNPVAPASAPKPGKGGHTRTADPKRGGGVAPSNELERLSVPGGFQELSDQGVVGLPE